MQVGRKLTAPAAIIAAVLCLPLSACVDTASQVRVEPAAAPSKIARRPGVSPRGATVALASVAGAPQDAPWTAPVRRALAEIDSQQTPADAPTKAAAPGPGAGDVAAAAKMGEGERNAFIRSMVARLADRLKQNGDDPEGWARLVRAYGVLGEKDRADEATGEARKALGADAAKFARFENALKAPPQ